VLVRNWRTRPSVAERTETISRSEPVAPAPPAAKAPTPAPAPDPAPAPPAPEPEPVAAAPSPIAPTPEPPRATASSSSPTVVSAQLCRSLSTTGAWRCESASGTQAPGRLYFYTRVAASRNTVVEHRWYRDDVLHQRVPLRIRPNQSGFRTYSRNTISPDRPGSWKVELRSEDGRVLHEETFAVR
jgi:outer membrane biosynthesis protein TonB